MLSWPAILSSADAELTDEPAGDHGADLWAGGIEPQVRVLDASGNRLPGMEVVRFANRAYEHVAVFRNPQFDDVAGRICRLNRSANGPGRSIIPCSRKRSKSRSPGLVLMATYDIRGKRDLGTVAKIQMTLDPWSPLVLTRAPEPIPKLRVESPAEAQPGRSLIVTLRSESPLPEGAFRIVRLEFVTPRANPYDLLRAQCAGRIHTSSGAFPPGLQ